MSTSSTPQVTTRLCLRNAPHVFVSNWNQAHCKDAYKVSESTWKAWWYNKPEVTSLLRQYFQWIDHYNLSALLKSEVILNTCKTKYENYSSDDWKNVTLPQDIAPIEVRLHPPAD